ncbi:hypothetical protein EJ04DRAFT_13762 [Polyplosphaeria fusca]|uniref:RRM domain-containing protein n=1 Tax=Polyplosphaeria fusca TaxID=682080 RepID=A0A9P4UYD6_9PLEO|nr:hypothetical protein EJ04DRAFT_13762 [Polyplosphaeria fusca]
MNGDSYRDGGRSGGRTHYGNRDDRRSHGDRSHGGDRGDRQRRRSRSPRRDSRRDRDRGGEYEVDTYSSSRQHREREREDQYSARRDRRDDRDWTSNRRDYGGRRDDDRAFRGRDRDDDRGGDRDGARGGRGGGRDRDRDRGDRFGGGRERKRSPSPPREKKVREVTPANLDSFVSIQIRPRRMTQWDIKPTGYENITAEQAKLSGMFPLPGGPRTTVMDTSRLQALQNSSTSGAAATTLKAGQSKQAKRLFVSNLPQGTTQQALTHFFNLQMNGLNVVSGKNPCVAASMSDDQTMALIEFKTTEDATYALALDRIQMEDNNFAHGMDAADNSGLAIRRPKDYIVPASATDDDYVENEVKSVVKDSPHKLSIANIPTAFDEDSLMTIMKEFGPLKSFVLARDLEADESRGVAFCEYKDPSQTDEIILAINGLEMSAGLFFRAQRASIGIKQAGAHDSGVGAMTMLAGGSSTDNQEKERVIMLLNMVTQNDLLDQQAVKEIEEDIRDECIKFGEILSLKMPRPSGARVNAGVGKVYVKFDTVEAAEKAMAALAGRKFESRTVVVTQYPEELFDVNAW